MKNTYQIMKMMILISSRQLLIFIEGLNELSPDFIQRLGSKLRIDCFALDPVSIKDWHDNRSLSNHFDPPVINQSDIFMMMTAFVLNQAWRCKFDPALTEKALFTNPDGTQKEVNMMYQNGEFDVSTGPLDRHVFELPYADPEEKYYNLKSLFIVPKDHLGYRELASQLRDPQILRELLRTKSSKRVDLDLYMPRYILDVSHNLLPVLKDLTPNPSIFESLKLPVVNHDINVPMLTEHAVSTKLTVDENGTSVFARSVLIGAFGGGFPKMTLKLNRPFFQILTDDDDTTYMIALIADPESPDQPMNHF
ncbi:MAG: serpin family protein [Candidatus Caenarcaniphilales bacterium]|nr:serpin family protein [Candidatus Caenarcaniphilales bacterium]